MSTIREKLMSLKAGDVIRREGKTLEVLAVVFRDADKALCRTDAVLLEPGRERFQDVPGKFLAAGKMIRLDNARLHVLYAQKSCDFEIVKSA